MREDSPYSNSRNPIFNIRNGFRSYTPLKENYFKGSTHPNEVRDYKSYIKTKEREFGILSSLKRKQKKLIDRLSPPRDHCKSRLENTQDEIDINKIPACELKRIPKSKSKTGIKYALISIK